MALTGSTACPECGSPVSESDRFCGVCGFDLATHRASQPQRAQKRTMLGLDALADARAPATEPDPGPRAPAPPEGAPPAEGEGPPTRPSRRPVTQRTMLGMPSPLGAPPQAAPPPAAAPGSVRPPQLQATQVGLEPPPGWGAPPGAGASPGAPTRADGVGPEGAGPTSRRAPPPSGRTMLGLPASPGPTESMRPPGGMAAAPPAAEAPRARSPVAYGSDFPGASADWSTPATPPPRSAGRLLWGLVALGAVLALGAVVALVWLLGDRGPDVQAEVVQTEQGEMLEVRVPGARPGTKVRLGGAELALDQNAARFPLAVDGLEVGENELALDVVSPDGDVDTTRLSLDVGYRVRADLAPLRDEQAAVRIAVDAPAGTRATLDGAALELDASGRGSRLFPLPSGAPDEDGRFDLSVAYHLELPSGEVEDGRVRTRVPYADLQLDRPGRSVVVDRDVIEVAGAVGSGASVTVDGAPVRLSEGRFLERISLPTLGERVIPVVARQPGRAPARIDVRVQRVANLAEAARGFEADPSLDYVRIVQNPSIYRGQKVRMTGRVYNVRVQNGRSILQVLVKDCPRGEACPLWVVYPAATDATLNDWVEILGEVAGEQQFKAESDRIVTVPRVDATYVLEARP